MKIREEGGGVREEIIFHGKVVDGTVIVPMFKTNYFRTEGNKRPLNLYEYVCL